MKLGDTIRAGCIGTYQIKKRLFDGDGGACALGALSIGMKTYGVPKDYVMLVWASGACPVCDKDMVLEVQIVHLNDDHGWTREAIADWIDATLYPVKEEPELIPAQEIMAYMGEPLEEAYAAQKSKAAQA